MTRRTARVAVATLVVVGLALVGITTYLAAERKTPALVAKPSTPEPSVYCDFYDFTRARVVVSFDFAVARQAEALDFRQRAIVEPDGTRTGFDDAERRQWSTSVEEGTKVIASPDGETRIFLYGLKPEKSGVFWTEAGLRSNRFRNLEGKCRQAYLGGGSDKGGTP